VSLASAAGEPSTGLVAASSGAEFTYGFTGYDVDVTVETDVEDGAPVSFDVAVEGDSVEDGETIAFDVSLTNDAGETGLLSTGPPLPFGLFELVGRESERRLHAWNEDYLESGHVHATRSRGVVATTDAVLSREVADGETVARTYTLSTETHRIQPGTYEGDLSFGFSTDDWETSWTVSADVAVALEPAGDSPTPEYERSLTAEPINDDGFDGRLDVDVLEPVTDAHPGLLEVSFESQWDERRGIEILREFPFGRYVDDSEATPRLVLQTEEMYAPGYALRDGCWRSAFDPEASASRGRVYTSVDPGETHSLRYVVFGHPGDGCPPAGEYTFTAHHETDGEDSLTKEQQQADLGFVLSLGAAPDGYQAAMTLRDWVERRYVDPESRFDTDSDGDGDANRDDDPCSDRDRAADLDRDGDGERDCHRPRYFGADGGR
jgi:hypothetical protein